MSAKRNVSKKVGLFLKGLAMGTANKVPGVSGGAVAFVLDFYEELIYTFQKVNGKALKLLLSGRFKSLYSYLNLTFLLLVMGGSLFSYFSVSLLLDYLLTSFEVYVWSCFFGMILGSVFYIGKRFKAWSIKNSLIVFIGFSIGLYLSFMSPATENDNLWFVFFCGIVGVSGMTLPGLSGSFILMLMGNYVLLLVDSVNVIYTVLNGFLAGNFEILSEGDNTKYSLIALVFFLGSLFGLISISHVLGYVLKRWNDLITALIIGFIAGSLGTVWPWKEKIYKTVSGVNIVDHNGNFILENYKRYIPDFTLLETWFVLIAMLFGAGIVLSIEYYERLKHTYES